MNKKSDWKERTMTTTMCQMFGDFFNRNFGEFINKSFSHCCQRNRLHSKKYHGLHPFFKDCIVLLELGLVECHVQDSLTSY